ncbi:H/ACA ribonucleoprotein complex subunit CBF5 [Vairimorpha necatrix]|uniref:H/ACA ribonucleoprotein complex subunit CBF5 n=1 Tax=Vairimorpha necatrix TaxID=6039 RepID=A0AAX4JC54_9MICR
MTLDSENTSPLLKNFDSMIIKSTDFTPMSCGFLPYQRPLDQHLNYGIVHVDKSSNPSSHEVVTWVKNILNCEKTGHCGTLDPKVSGVLTICLNRATRLTKSQQTLGKEYVCVIEFEDKPSRKAFNKAVEKLTGLLYQRPPLMCAVKRDLRLRNIYKIEIIEFSKSKKQALFKVSCEAGTYIRTLCVHIGLMMGCPATMAALRRIRSGLTEESECFTLHDLKDAKYVFDRNNEEIYLRRVIRPLEEILVEYPKIIVKDSCINALCYGAKLCVSGILRLDPNINIGQTIVVVSVKGEAICLADTIVSSAEILMMDHGYVAQTKRVIMEKDLYLRGWGTRKEYELLCE